MARTKRNATTERVFLFFKNYVRQHHREPAIRDISNGISGDDESRVSTSVIDYHLKKLVAQGRLGRGERRTARAYYLPDAQPAAQPAGDPPEVLPSPIDPILVLPDSLLPARLYLDLLHVMPDRLSASIVFDRAITSLPDTHRATYRFLQGHKHPRRRADIAAHLGLLPRQIAPSIRELGALRLIEGVVDQRDGETIVVYSATPFGSLFQPEAHP